MYYHTSKQVDPKERKIFVTKAVKKLGQIGIGFIHMSGEAFIELGDVHIPMPVIFNESMILSLETNLRTLDLVHIASAKHAKQVFHDLEAFVTADEEILSNKDIARIIGMPVQSPGEYVQILKE